jgi:hypothetical protein
MRGTPDKQAHLLQNVETQHPPHKKKRNDAEDNVCHPLTGGFWLSKVKHCGNPSIRLRHQYSAMAAFQLSALQFYPANIDDIYFIRVKYDL